MLNRVRKRYPKIKRDAAGEPLDDQDKDKKELAERGISLSDYLQFFHFLGNITDVDIALTFFNMAGAGIDKETLKHAASTVAHIELRDHLIEVIFTLFDENRE